MMKDARDRVVQEFREGTTKVLISTDVLSRGFDVTQVRQRQLAQVTCCPNPGGDILSLAGDAGGEL